MESTQLPQFIIDAMPKGMIFRGCNESGSFCFKMRAENGQYVIGEINEWGIARYQTFFLQMIDKVNLINLQESGYFDNGPSKEYLAAQQQDRLDHGM